HKPIPPPTAAEFPKGVRDGKNDPGDRYSGSLAADGGLTCCIEPLLVQAVVGFKILQRATTGKRVVRRVVRSGSFDLTGGQTVEKPFHGGCHDKAKVVLGGTHAVPAAGLWRHGVADRVAAHIRARRDRGEPAPHSTGDDNGAGRSPLRPTQRYAIR